MCISFRGAGFLKHLLRRVVSLLMQIGAGMESADTVDDVLAGRRPWLHAAPPHGLHLRRMRLGPYVAASDGDDESVD